MFGLLLIALHNCSFLSTVTAVNTKVELFTAKFRRNFVLKTTQIDKKTVELNIKLRLVCLRC